MGVHRVGSRRRTLAGIVTLALVVTACAGGDDGRVDDAGESVSTASTEGDRSTGDWLAGVSIVSSTVEELDELRFVGVDVDRDLADVEFVVGWSGGEMTLPLYIDDQGVYGVAPLHPETPGDGGDVEVWLTSDDGASPTLAVDLTGLPEAEGAWNEMVTDLIDEIEARARTLGSSFADLASVDFDAVAAELLPLKMMQGVVDDDSDNDLESLLATSDLNVAERALVESIIAKIDPMSALTNRVAAQPVGFRGASVTAPAEALIGALTPARTLQADCFTYPLTIGNGAQLADAVATGVGSIPVPGGAEEQVLQDIDTLTTEASDIPLIGKGIAMIGTGFTVITSLMNATAGIYPTRFSSVSAGVSTVEFNEDFKHDGTVDRVTVVASSTGFDASEIVAGLSKEAIKKLGGKLSKSLAKNNLDPGLPLTPEQQLDGVIESEVLKLGDKLRNTALGTYIDAITENNFNICPRDWSVDITDDDYVAIENILNLSVDSAALTYKPTDVGPAFLKVRVRAEAFSGLTVELQVTIETKQLRVIVDPGTIRVENPGDTHAVTARVENADTPTLHWDPGEGEWTDGVGEDTNEGRTRSHKTSTNPDAYWYPVIVTSTSTTGLRAEATDERNGSVSIELAEFKIVPNPAQVGEGQPIQFMAIDHDGNPVEVGWAAGGGTISRDGGLYVAGDEPGTYTVTATKVSDSSKVATGTVEVIELDCLVGTWDLDEQAFVDALGAAAGFSATHIAGQYRVIMRANGTYTGIRDDWTLEISTPDGALRMKINSEDPGTWTVAGTTLTLNESGSSATIEMAILQDGQLIPVPIGPQTVDVPGLKDSGTYECVGNTLTTVNKGIAVRLVRIGPAT